MPFINEEISSNDKSKYDFSKFQMKSIRNINETRIKKWTIDKKHDAFLIPLKGQMPEMPAIYGYYITNCYCQVYAYRKLSRETPTQIRPTLTWNIQGFLVCHGAYEDKEKFISDIKRAFYAHGYLFKPEDYEKIDVIANMKRVGEVI